MTIVESVARAIHTKLYGSDVMWRESEDVARAAIAAMRHPTLDMVRAGLATKWPALYKQGLFLEFDGPSMLKETNIRVNEFNAAFHAAVSAALEE